MNTNICDQIKTTLGPTLFRALSCTVVLSLLSLSVLGQDKPTGGDVVHAVGGVVTKVDSAAKTMAVKLADGTEQAFKYTPKTIMHVSKETGRDAMKASVDTYMAGKEGTHVVIHYTGKGTDKTAVAVHDFGKDGLKFSQGTVTHVDKAAGTLTIKTENGTEETYRVAKHATIDTEHGVVKGTELVAKDGEKVTVHYSEDGGKKFIHLLRRI